MNPAMALEQQGIATAGIGELFAFVNPAPSKTSIKKLPGAAEEVFQGIGKVLDNLMRRAITAKTAEDFDNIRRDVFGSYYRTMSAISNLSREMIPKNMMESLVADSLSELENTFKEEGLARFGVLARDQAVFTVWTLGKISRLAHQMAGMPLHDSKAGEDRRIAQEFAFFIGWSNFHLDCLRASISHDRIVNPEVLIEICDGLRAVVNAYGLVRQGLDLRSANAELELPFDDSWDEEDQELLDASMRDMAMEEIL